MSEFLMARSRFPHPVDGVPERTIRPPGKQDQSSGTWNPAPGIWNLESGIRNPESGIRNLESYAVRGNDEWQRRGDERVETSRADVRDRPPGLQQGLRGGQ